MTRLVRFSNNAVSQLAANLLVGETSLSVTPGEGSKFPSLSAGQYFMATIVKVDGSTEVVKVTARSTDAMTIVRAAEPVAGASTAYAFTAGDRIEARLTAGVLGGEIDRLDNGSIFETTNKSANYTVVEADVTTLIRVSTASGTITITLPQISTLTDDFDILVAKVTGDANSVVIQRSGTTDLINGASSTTLFNQYQSAWVVADRSTNTWTVIGGGLNAVNTVVDSGTGDGSTANVTLSGDPGSKNNVLFVVGGVYQQKSTYTISGTTLTAGATIPNGVKWEAVWSAPLTIGTPSDGTVTVAKLADGALAATTQGLAKMADGFLQATTAGLAKMADGFLAATTAGRAKMADLFVTTAKIDNNAVTLAKMARVGTAGQVLTSGGTGADPAYATLNTVVPTDVQTFNSTGTWTKPSGGQTMARIQVWGGGGGAWRSSSANNAGGGGGAYVEITLPLSYLAATVTATVGAGGAGATVNNGSGGQGGNSSFTLASSWDGINTLIAYGGGGAGCVAAGPGGAGAAAVHRRPGDDGHHRQEPRPRTHGSRGQRRPAPI